MAKLTLGDITTSGTGFDVQINNNNTLIEAALENTLSRDGTSPNAMGVDLDMNSFNINNVKDAVLLQSAVTLAQLNAAVLASGNIVGTVTDAAVRFDGTSFIEETQVRISAAGVLTILDAGLTDSVAISHDGTDINIVGTNAIDLNLTGITALKMGTVDLDADAITATSYGGILEANLLDKTANESLTGGNWTFNEITFFTKNIRMNNTIKLRALNAAASAEIDLAQVGAGDDAIFGDAGRLTRIRGTSVSVDATLTATSYVQLDTATSAQLNAIADAINTAAGKIQGAVVYNTTTDNPVYATGNTDGSTWVDGAGTVVNTPV